MLPPLILTSRMPVAFGTSAPGASGLVGGFAVLLEPSHAAANAAITRNARQVIRLMHPPRQRISRNEFKRRAAACCRADTRVRPYSCMASAAGESGHIGRGRAT